MATKTAQGLGEPPTTLPAEVQAIWREFAPVVSPSIGRPGLEALVAQVVRMRDAQRRISMDGAVVVDAKGNAAAHPAIAIERIAGEEIRKWMARYGR